MSEELHCAHCGCELGNMLETFVDRRHFKEAKYFCDIFCAMAVIPREDKMFEEDLHSWPARATENR